MQVVSPVSVSSPPVTVLEGVQDLCRNFAILKTGEIAAVPPEDLEISTCAVFDFGDGQDPWNAVQLCRQLAVSEITVCDYIGLFVTLPSSGDSLRANLLSLASSFPLPALLLPSLPQPSALSLAALPGRTWLLVRGSATGAIRADVIAPGPKVSDGPGLSMPEAVHEGCLISSVLAEARGAG